MKLSTAKTFAKKAAPVALISLAAIMSGCASSPCSTTVVSSGSRTYHGDDTTKWSGVENMRTTCNYRGNTDPGSFNAPSHLEHMNGENKKSGTGWISP